MKIWIDGYEANVPQRLGSSQVAFELIRHFEKTDKQNEYTVLLPAPPLGDLPKMREGWKYKILKPKRLWTRLALPLTLFTVKDKPQVFFSPTHYIPSFVPSSVKRIATIFDLSFLHFPQMFDKIDLWQLTNGTKFSALNADHIITISNFSKQDIIKQYGVDKNKITVAYPGYDREKFRVNEIKGENYVFPKEKGKVLQASSKISHTASEAGPYIIYIGTVQPRKNLIRLIEAVSRIDNLNLVIVGKEGWMYEETLETPKRLGIENRVKFLGFMQDEDLAKLLSGAQAFVLPSLYEGFGLTVIEAMACGVPVIVSNVSSLPEVVGKAGLLVDPYSENQIEQAIRVVISDKKLRLNLSKLGFEQVKQFSWEKMARTVLKVFEESI